jgi:hypothetical protein
MVTRPGMWATDGRAFDVLARGLIADLCFLDEREQDLDDVHAVLHGYGKLGVAGPFIALFGKDRNCVAEVGSVLPSSFTGWATFPQSGCSTQVSGTASPPASANDSMATMCAAARSRPASDRQASSSRNV